jgi:hypothetical protein
MILAGKASRGGGQGDGLEAIGEKKRLAGFALSHNKQ